MKLLETVIIWKDWLPSDTSMVCKLYFSKGDVAACKYGMVTCITIPVLCVWANIFNMIGSGFNYYCEFTISQHTGMVKISQTPTHLRRARPFSQEIL